MNLQKGLKKKTAISRIENHAEGIKLSTLESVVTALGKGLKEILSMQPSKDIECLGDSKIIESYDADKRCLILGHFLWNNKAKSPLHIVCDYSNKKIIDIVTAYIPQKPWWMTQTQRGKRI